MISELALDSNGASGSLGSKKDMKPAARRREPESSSGRNANTVMDSNRGTTSKSHSTRRFDEFLRRDLTEACKISDAWRL